MANNQNVRMKFRIFFLYTALLAGLGMPSCSDRSTQFPEVGDQVVLARNEAVVVVGDRSNDEKDVGRCEAVHVFERHEPDEDEGHDHAGHAEFVWQIHCIPGPF